MNPEFVRHDNKARYQEKAEAYRKLADAFMRTAGEKELEAGALPEKAGLIRLQVADAQLRATGMFLAQYHVIHALLRDVHNDDILQEARKALYACVGSLERVYSPYVDAPFSDSVAKLDALKGVNEFDRYDLVYRVGFYLSYVESLIGENGKWRWPFVEMHSRVATLLKNSFDLREVVPALDPRVPDFARRVGFINLARSLLQQAAMTYRLKYESFTHVIGDFKRAILYLESLKRFYIYLNRPNEAEELSRQIDTWKAKMEKDSKSKDSSGS